MLKWSLTSTETMKLFRDGEKEETGYREENYVHLCVATQELQERYRLSSEG